MADMHATSRRPHLVAWAWGGLLVLLVAAGAYALSGVGARGDTAGVLRPDDPQVVNMGARIYTQHCAACHGTRGEGQPDWRERGPDGLMRAPPHDESGHTWHHPDAQLVAITKHGLAKLIRQPDYQTHMPVYDGVLSDPEIIAVLSWIKAQWPKEIRARHDELNAQSQTSPGG
jgi:mono/diheme cytochrome c family protein